MLNRTTLAVALAAALGITTATAVPARDATPMGNTIAASGAAAIVLARADDPPSDVRRGRGRDDGIGHKRQGADDPPGDVRRGRGRDDGPNHA